jgi:hypothetical protein
VEFLCQTAAAPFASVNRRRLRLVGSLSLSAETDIGSYSRKT